MNESFKSVTVQFIDPKDSFFETNRLLTGHHSLVLNNIHCVCQESGPLQSPLTSDSINGTDERVAPATPQLPEVRAEPSQNALPFSHR